MISWLILLLLIGLAACRDSKDGFDEFLSIKPLQDGRVDTAFNFTISDQDISPHSHLFPLPLVNLLTSPELDIDELHLSLSAGRWDYDKWHYPTFPQLGSSGAEVWVSHKSDRSQEKWNRVVHRISGLFCASLSTSDNTNHLLLDDKTWTYAQISSQLPCTENLTPFIALLPCKSAAGLGQLLNPHKIFDADYHSLALSMFNQGSGARLEIKVEAVFNPARVDQQRQYSTKAMFDRTVKQKCELADSSMVYFGLPPPPGEELNQDVWVVLPEDHEGEVKDGTIELDLMTTSKQLGLALIWPFQETFIYPRYTTKPPIQIRRDQIAGPVEETFTMKITIENTQDEDAQVSYLQSIPWQVKPWLHTFRIYGDSSSDSTSFKHNQAKADKEPYSLQVNTTLAPHSETIIECIYQRQFLKYTDYAPDIHRGIDIPPGFIRFEADNMTKVAYTTPMLVDLATPDFSMPYNVIIITSTVVALFFGSVYNILVRDFQLIPKKESKSD
ncbi:hypothetical protein E3P89_00946 [Wallemia ichthyophaga]|uniref:GPI transamidase component PIG-T n=2 Tax=Wallemia ichthyophaga TaxID=245174 RepID=A0A4T0GTL7_WALIC|nr:GPI transamidase component PIG-T [Wallemia ichthyophaga EXF-994]TIA82546.1 hypothetical protein E3P98_01257 [Wallemia ichthyophaga]EOR00279.1 GPI transamidase component PIG-T [Wallemia ichthyophaga EXF-994]TIA92409.1 hypothetical protein E3P97_01422 [Wallemia ichthyophaga]TIB05918.1 hypothetical protein E3P96_00782 [Wallemia ichthyophaga]TIB14649.1 hypothetical protein E3P90_01241 [Wallemia ichthyophaga]